MSAKLHLPSLSIEGFRGIAALDLTQLGRVTLLAGVNGVGKTTILDAIRLYAARGEGHALVELIDTHEEFVRGTDTDGDTVLFPDFSSLFHGHDPGDPELPPPAWLRSRPTAHNLSLELVDAVEGEEPAAPFAGLSPPDLTVTVGRHARRLRAAPMHYYRRAPRQHFFGSPIRRTDSGPSQIHIESLGPGLLRNSEIARLWDGVALTEAEDIAVETVRLIVGDRLERLTVIGDPEPGGRGRRVVAKLATRSAPVPLKRLGDGANRLLAIALALANCRGGMLLMDEVENGIHYSIQPDLWRMVFGAAEAANVQVIAATHSWDCVVGFAAAATESVAEGQLYRIERFKDGVEAIGYSEDNLAVAARQRTEVR